MGAPRITVKMLEHLCKRVNEATGSPITPYTKSKDGKFYSNVDNYHLYQAYGGVGVARMCSKGGGITTVINITTKRQCYDQFRAYLDGVIEGQASQ